MSHVAASSVQITTALPMAFLHRPVDFQGFYHLELSATFRPSARIVSRDLSAEMCQQPELSAMFKLLLSLISGSRVSQLILQNIVCPPRKGWRPFPATEQCRRTWRSFWCEDRLLWMMLMVRVADCWLLSDGVTINNQLLMM